MAPTTGLLGAAEVTVVGSLNLDLVVRVPRLPGPGETVAGDDVFRNPGGKGAASGTVVLNPAPAQPLPAAVLGQVDVLVPNRVELAQLAGAPVPETVEDAVGLAGRLPVRAVDTTAAGAGGQASLPTPAEVEALTEAGP